MNRIKYILYIVIFLLTSSLFAQNLPKFSMKADTTVIRIGEQIKLHLQTETDTLSFIDFPEPSSLGDFEVVSTSDVDTLTETSIRKLSKDYYITKWDSGQYVVPSIDIKINDRIFKTDSLQINVLGVAVDTIKQPLYGFKEVIDVKNNGTKNANGKGINWWWLIALLLLIPLFFFLRKKRKEYIEKHKPLSAFEKAEQTLDSLKQNNRLLERNIDQYYLQLTDILKDFLEEELHFSAKEKISSQLLGDLRKYSFNNGEYFDEALLQRLQQTFRRADLAKFAQMQPQSEDVQFDFTVINDIISQAHRMVLRFEEEKESAEEEILKMKKRVRRTSLIIVASLILLTTVGFLFGRNYLRKKGLWHSEKMALSSHQWVYSEYGGFPALGVTTPYILDSYNILDFVKDKKIKQILTSFDEISFYADNNIIKEYTIIEFNLDLKKEIEDTKQTGPLIMTGMLQQIKATDVKVEQEEIENGVKYYGQFTSDFGPFHKKQVYAFESRIYSTKTGIRTLIGVRYQGNEQSKKLIDRVMSSVELVK